MKNWLIILMGLLTLGGCVSNPDVVRKGDFEFRFEESGVVITGYTSTKKTVVIPRYIWIRSTAHNVVGIADRAFANLGLEQVSFEEIDSSYWRIRIIGEQAFYGNNLVNLTLPSSLILIESKAFANNQLTAVRCNVEDIAEDAFANNPGLTSVPIGQSTRQRLQQEEYTRQQAVLQVERQAEQERLADIYRKAGNSFGNLRNTAWSYGANLGGSRHTINERLDFGDGNYILQRTSTEGTRWNPYTGTFRVNGDTVFFLSSEGEYNTGTIIGNALTINDAAWTWNKNGTFHRIQ